MINKTEQQSALMRLLTNKPFLIVLFVAFTAVVLLLNLGLMPLDSDEPTRAMVAFEMMKSGNYIVPKIFGEYYYNKPPLYNWFIILSYKSFGVVNEFTTRFPTILSLFGYVITIFFFSKKHFGVKWAWVNALIFMTCGRILFWDSMLGLIDICFSWVNYAMFMSVYYFFEKKAWYKLFIVAYALAAIAFLMKGLPSVVFVGATLFIWFLLNKEFKRLFFLPHFVGLGVFVFIVGSYYLTYHQYNDLETAWVTLFTETSKRTAVRFGVWRTILHLFTFPFEMMYHFLPWSLFSLFLLRKDFWKQVRANRFIYYCSAVFAINIIPYWTSVEVFPRYLLMLAPLVFTVSLYFYKTRFEAYNKSYKSLEFFFVGISALAVLAVFSVFFIPQTKGFEYIGLKVVAVVLLMLPGVYVMYKERAYRLIAFSWVLLVVRLGFDWFLLPARFNDIFRKDFKEKAIAAAEKTKGKPLSLSYDGVIGHFSGFYFSTTRDEILPVSNNVFETAESDTLLIMNTPPQNENEELIGTFNIIWEKSERYVVKH